MAAFSSSEDCTVKYKLFSTLQGTNFNQISRSEAFELLAESCVTKLSGILQRYIWQKDSFNLLFTCESGDVPAHLEGSTCFEDNIEDEWFIVYLLFHLTEKDKNLVVQVQDNDGEFLLIEAAEHLPRWLNPDSSENRVFIHQGSLHIIPEAQNPGEITPIPSGTPSLLHAVAAVRNFSSTTRASDAVQEAIQRRIRGYPQRINELKHRAHCYVPAAVCSILKEDPSLLPKAVRAFCQRDPLDMKACRAMKNFAPETRVMTEVIFTRCLYAQLSSQQYAPDKIIGWNLPGKNNPSYKSHDLGMKLACGFEILASNAAKSMDHDSIINRDFNNDVRWKRFAKNLKDRGYFRGEIEGSILYRQLMAQAKDFYLSSLKRDSNGNQSPGVKVCKFLQELNHNFEDLQELEKTLLPADDDSWMDVTPESLDALLGQVSQTECKSDIGETITGGLKTFLYHKSDIEGAELPQKSKKQKITFEAEAFSEAVNKILDFRIPGSDDECSSSSMSGYSDDDDDDVNLGEGESQSKGSTKDKSAVLQDMKSYMEQMDHELAKTDVGLSFERIPLQPYSSQREKGHATLDHPDIDAEHDDFQPVDVDLTALKNILESYSSQQGLPGPASNLFSSMGLPLPHDLDS